MSHSLRTHGVLLRRLIEHLDGAVEQLYVDAGLDYRPRYTPLVRALLNDGPATLRALSTRTGVTHSAVSQTVSQMAARDWVSLTPGKDGRERIVTLTPGALERLPQLERCWVATERASRALDDDIGQPLSEVLVRALEALDRQPFSARLAEAADQDAGAE